jgi:uncharacterized protein
VKIVLDTNILFACYSPKSKYYPIWKAFEDSKFELCVTTDILEEYDEIISNKANPKISRLLIDIILQSNNTILITKYFFWQLIKSDPDDNKFVDCGLMANADFIVTEDRHFNEIKNLIFPRISVINTKEFIEILNKF